MSSTEVKGPSGNRAEVSSSKRQLTSAAFYDLMAKISADSAEASVMYSGNMILKDATAQPPLDAGQPTQGFAVHWFRNSHPTKNLVIHSASWGSDGGSDRSLHTTFLCKPIFASHLLPPTGNIGTLFETIPKRENLANQTPPEIEAYAWDGVGNGLIMPLGSYNNQRKIQQFIVQRGYQDTSWESAFIMPPGSPAVLHMFDAPGLPAGSGETLNCHITIKAFHAPVCNPWENL